MFELNPMAITLKAFAALLFCKNKRETAAFNGDNGDMGANAAAAAAAAAAGRYGFVNVLAILAESNNPGWNGDETDLWPPNDPSELVVDGEAAKRERRP
ncbi:hypothetical protein DERF_007280 [Dermatophagoides farinae]|uniref:Uncharacterized protein n=1 Tax=Dermatophagoides farinae TaxID=6954 RepID=A0A922I348_DERFA|nr:hypothetical protein DERF_007280 [Dermatophagoides farinae]